LMDAVRSRPLTSATGWKLSSPYLHSPLFFVR
jgi:hypothetical protein